MWLNKRLGLLHARPVPAVLLGEPRWGAPYLIAALARAGKPSVWLELLPRDEGDPIAQGNKLADAVKRALGSPLFGYAMPYRYGLSVLKTHLDLLGPFTFALSSAEHAPELANDLLSLQDEQNSVVLHFTKLPDNFTLPEKHLLLDAAKLALTIDEARELAGGKLPEEEVQRLWEKTGGAYESFLLALTQRLSLPPPLRPFPEGLQAVPGYEVETEPAAILDILLQKGRWLEALELAARQLPTRVPEVLAAAGEAPWTQGLQGRLYGLLSALPEDVKQQGIVLGWRLLSALALGKEREVLPDVERLLAQDEAPELRALYAEACFARSDLQACLQESKRAAQALEAPITLYSYGRALALENPHAGLEQLEHALHQAEAKGERYFAAQVAEALAARLTTLGRYRSAADWAAWGLKLYHRQGMGQVLVRLALVNELAFARILSGEAVGLEDTLRHESGSLEGVHPSLARLLRTTLADLLLIQGNMGESLSLYREIWLDNERRENVGALANLYVRALLEAGEEEEALRIAEQAVELSRGLHLINTRRAVLALGMALSDADPGRAATVLEEALREFQKPIFAPRLAQASLYLARARLRLGDPERARLALEAGQVGLQELGGEGLHYLAGPPEAFQEVFGLLTGEQVGLELRFLGGIEAGFEGRNVKLSRRSAELLTVLALHPDGLSGEQVTLSVYGELGNPKVCKAELNRLQRKISLKNRPYRLGIAVRADFLELDALLRDGLLMQALALYRGPLLPKSEAPEVIAAREHLDETLRQAVLASGNPEALWALAERWSEDLELWEALIASLGEADPRRASALARVKGLERSWEL